MPPEIPADLDAIVTRGGAPYIALLRACVISVAMEPIFVFLVQDYRVRPGHRAALALYDAFCAAGARAPIRAPGALPPHDLRLVASIDTIRRQWDQLRADEAPAEGTAIPITTPYRHLFDDVVRAVREDASGRYARLARTYDPALSPAENLPGGRMTDVQRHFVEHVWKPVVRPHLIAAGFSRIADIE